MTKNLSLPHDKAFIYRMPAEWHPHSGTQLHWPDNKETWPGERLARAEEVFAQIITALSNTEQIHLFTPNETVKRRALERLSGRDVRFSNIFWHIRPINDVWARDCGPIFVKGDEGWALTNWKYNAWGGKYPPFENDNQIPAYVSERFSIPRFDIDFVLEGGSIEVNGAGMLLTTESVLLNPNRNPKFNKQEIEGILKFFLGVTKVVWLKNGLAGDDTDGHIDDLARFIAEDTVLAMVCHDVDDPNYQVLNENLEILKNTTLPNGKPLKIETLPLPKTRIEGQTVDGSVYVPASYANFYIANGVVLVPQYSPDYDHKALQLFKKYFPQRKIIGIECGDLVWGQGSIHCVTQQWYGVY